jgi:hypothetical protein
MKQLEVEFPADGNVTLRGWLFVPDEPGPRPAITMAHGYAGLREHHLEPFARVFADAGFVVLVHDHRGFGASDGEPRQDIDPWQQIADWRYAISYLEAHPSVDADRIGLWGTSYAGGHALVLGATDRRLKAVVAQVPTISGYEQGRRRVAPDRVAAVEAAFTDDERRRFAGEPPATQLIVSATEPAAYSAPDAVAFYSQHANFENRVTVRSGRAARMYEPGLWASRVSPTPLLMIVALDDTITLTDTGLAAYERALEPKRLLTVPGGHFEAYLSQFDQTSAAARDWFASYLSGKD